MKSNELRIGNIIEYYIGEDGIEWSQTNIDWQDLQWISAEEISFNESHRPIPLTEDWLLRFGFVKEKDVECPFPDSKFMLTHGRFQVFSKDTLTYNTIHGWWHYSRKVDWPLKFVHQLQNIVFALTGEELKIESK